MTKKEARAKYAKILEELAAPAIAKPIEGLKRELGILAIILFGAPLKPIPIKIRK